MSRVKLYVCEEHPTRTIIDTYETESFDDFCIVRAHMPWREDAELLKVRLDDLNTGKKFVIIPPGIDIAVYGIREDDDSRPARGELQHKRDVDQTAGDAEF